MDKFLLQHLFKESVLKYPDKIAVIDGEREISYRELDEKSTLAANMLIKMGVNQRDVIVTYINKSIESIISFLAVLKAGGAYIPVDGNYIPYSRVERIIELSMTNFVITNNKNWTDFNRNCSKVSNFDDKKILLLDTLTDYNDVDTDFKVNENCIFLDNSLNIHTLDRNNNSISEDTAYILYTSGSTGDPKGVILTHLNAITFVNWSINYFMTNNNDIFSSHAAFHFDLSVFDIYVALASGGTINLIPFNVGQNPRLLFNWIISSKITYWYSVPSVWITILNYANPEFKRLSTLKNILFAGEEFPSLYLKKLIESLPEAKYFNLYGPTETNVCTVYNVKTSYEIGNEPVPIGEACQNTEIIVLNNDNNIVKIGEEGELFVRGTTVTKGYYKNDEKTKDVFIKSPLEYHNGSLLYRTGDLVKRIDEKNYRYIGRIDNMVKISGFRVELQEIESVLLNLEIIEEVAAKAIYSESRGSKILYAFVKTNNKQKCSVLELKDYCSKYLPYYMVPEVFVMIDEMPRNANGKIDEKRLLNYAL